MSNPMLLEVSKKRKRNPKFYGLHTFAEPGCPISPSGPFRDNIRYFLRQCAEPEEYNVEGMPIWCTFLVHENKGVVLPLYTIEECVKHSFQPFCDQCRCTGWSHHFVSKRKYHFIIPVDSEWLNPLGEGVFNMQTHLLHGLIHCNGFGHLLCINGTEGGSKYICGREIMDLWDRICTNLQTRKISVEDMSKKRNMDLRLLHGVAYGHPWFGRWGYRFCCGSFGVTQNKYETAIEILCSLELDMIVQDFTSSSQYREVKKIISQYRDLSETDLITIRDILKFMLEVKSRAPRGRKPAFSAIETSSSSRSRPSAVQGKPLGKEKLGKCRKFSSVAVNLDSRWSVRRLEYVANVVVDALKEKKVENTFGNGGMTRQELRDAARLHIGDTGLIDYVLKCMNNVIVGCHIVRRAMNPSTRILEFSLEEHGNSIQSDSRTEIVPQKVDSARKHDIVLGSDVYTDVGYLYNTVLLDYSESEQVEFAVRTVLDSKHFVKEWPFKDEADELLRFICRVIPVVSDIDTKVARRCLHGEYVVVPLHATVGELKLAVQNAMKDTYCVMEGLRVTDIEELEGLEDQEVIFGAVESGSEIRVSGFGVDYGSDLKYEGGADNWTVNCKCGAKDDDGERMVACDICEVWQHTRCSGIEDTEAVPPLFVCPSCCSSLAPAKPHRQPTFEYIDSLVPGFEYTSSTWMMTPFQAEPEMWMS